MGIVFRQSVKATFVTFLGALFGVLLMWLSTKYIPDKQQFGFIRNLLADAVMAAQIFLIGIQYTLGVFIHRYEFDNVKRKTFLSVIFAAPLIFISIAIFFYYVFKIQIISHFQPQDIPYVVKYFWWLPLYALLFMYQLVLEQYMISQMKVAASAFIKEIPVRIVNIILIILFSCRYIDFNGLIIYTVLINAITVFLYFIYSSRTKNFGFSLRLNIFRKDDYREMLHFSWYHGLLLISMSLIGGLDVLLLPFGDKKGLSVLPVYVWAIYITSFLQLPARAMASAVFPLLTQAFRDDDKKKAKDLFNRSSINIFIATAGMVLVIVCNLHNLVNVLNNGYGLIIPITLILMIGRIIDQSTGMNDQVLSITNYYKFNFYLSLVLVVIMYFLTRTLIHRYGVYGAAWSSTIIFFLFNLAKFFFVWKKTNMQPFSKGTLLVLVACVPALVVGYYLPYVLNPFADTVLRSTLIIIIYLALLILLKPSPDLSAYLASIKKNKRLF